MQYKTIYDLPTPAFGINIDIFRNNCKRMSDRASKIGLNIRPHVKTHKTVQGAQIQVEDVPEDKKAIVVSTMSEMKYFADGGFQNILLGIPFGIHHIKDLETYSKKIRQLNVLVDDKEHIDFLRNTNGHYHVFIKIDTGYHRAGISCEKLQQIINLIQYIQSCPTCEFEGIYSHAGHSYDQESIEDIQQVANTEKECMQTLSKYLKEASFPCPVVSCGSTPACSLYTNWEGITEIHPGNYCCYDRVQCSLGSCKEEDIAVTVITSILAQYPDRNTLLCDAGGIPLSKDKGDLSTWASVVNHEELYMGKVSQEHGLLTSTSPIDFKQYPIGTHLLLHPNHSCMTAAQYPKFYIYTSDGTIVDEWIPAKYWN
ncbi:hypothetical protein WA158_005632 [Blastocystis sp. Blastoise]